MSRWATRYMVCTEDRLAHYWENPSDYPDRRMVRSLCGLETSGVELLTRYRQQPKCAECLRLHEQAQKH